MSAGFKVPSIFTAVDRFTRPVQKMMGVAQTFGSRVDGAMTRASRSVGRFTKSIKAAVGQFGLFLGATAAVGAFTGAMNIMIEYEQANANLAAILGKTTQETRALQNESKRLGATTAFTASQVTELQTEFGKLGFTQQEIVNATESTLALAAATGTELPQAATQVGAAIRAFGLDASEAGRVADVFAASTTKSALDMTKLDVAMSKVAPVAKQFGFSIEDTTALMASLSDAGFDASTMATSTRSILLNLADGNGKLAKALGKPARTLPEVTSAMVELREKGIDVAGMLDLTDKRSVAAFATFLEGAEKINVLGTELKAAGGTAEDMAKKQLNTLKGSLTILDSAYQGFILSLDSGSGSFARFIRATVDVTAEVFSLLSGMQKSKDELSASELKTRKIANTVIFLGKALGIAIAAFQGLRLIIFLTKAVTAGYNVVLGISNALQGKSLIMSKRNTLAMMAQMKTIKVITLAQKAWAIVTQGVTGAFRIFNMVLRANPIGAIITLIIALIAGITWLWKNIDGTSEAFKKWGAILGFIAGPLGMVFALVKAVASRWDEVVAAFKSEGIRGALMAIGNIINDFIKGSIDGMKESFIQVWAFLKDRFFSIIEKIKGQFHSLKQLVISGLLMPIKAILRLTSKIGVGKQALAKIEQFEQSSNPQQMPNLAGMSAADIGKGVAMMQNMPGLQNLNLDAVKENLRTQNPEALKDSKLRLILEAAQGTSLKSVDSSQSSIPVTTEETGSF